MWPLVTAVLGNEHNAWAWIPVPSVNGVSCIRLHPPETWAMSWPGRLPLPHPVLLAQPRSFQSYVSSWSRPTTSAWGPQWPPNCFPRLLWLQWSLLHAVARQTPPKHQSCHHPAYESSAVSTAGQMVWPVEPCMIRLLLPFPAHHQSL